MQQINFTNTSPIGRSQSSQAPVRNRPQGTKKRFVSEPFPNAAVPDHGKAFPKKFTYSGYLDVKGQKTSMWKRRYFVLSNNFLLCAATPHAESLESCISLEGSQVDKDSTKKASNTLTFEVFARKKLMYFRAPSPNECKLWKIHIAKAAKLKIKDIYRFMYSLGDTDSQMNKVVAAKHRTSGEDAAIKIVDKRMCDAKLLKTEIQILKKLDNKHIVQLYDIFETKKYLYIVMEMCLGGELFDQIADLDGDYYSVKDCCLILHQIAHGVEYMHQVLVYGLHSLFQIDILLF